MKTWKLPFVVIFVIIAFGAALTFATAFGNRSHCIQIAKVHEVLNDSTYVTQTVELCHGPVR